MTARAGYTDTGREETHGDARWEGSKSESMDGGWVTTHCSIGLGSAAWLPDPTQLARARSSARGVR